MTQKVTYQKSIKVNLSEDFYEKVEALAQEKGLSKSAIVRMAIREKVKA